MKPTDPTTSDALAPIPASDPTPVYRKRRGKVVRVPDEWVGKVTSRQTINARPSKQPPRQRKAPAETRKAATEREDKRADKEGRDR